MSDLESYSDTDVVFDCAPPKPATEPAAVVSDGEPMTPDVGFPVGAFMVASFKERNATHDRARPRIHKGQVWFAGACSGSTCTPMVCVDPEYASKNHNTCGTDKESRI